jgi:hypothetical protein
VTKLTEPDGNSEFFYARYVSLCVVIIISSALWPYTSCNKCDNTSYSVKGVYLVS